MAAERVDLFRPFLAPEAAQAAARVLTPDPETGMAYIGDGQLVAAFEHALTEMFCSDVPLLATNSCTSAIDLALHLCGVGPGDYVVSTPMTCTATNGPVLTRGATVLWADVDPLTGLLDPESAGRLLRNYAGIAHPIKAIIAVDWAGRACEYNALRDVAGGIPIIEDAAHAPVANYLGRPIGYMGGDYVCWSLGAIKHVTAGDGCGVLKVPQSHHERARLLRWHGLDRTKGDSFRCQQNIAEVGYRYNTNDLTAAIGLANIKHLPDVVYAHRQHARYYTEALKDAPGVTVPPWDAGCSYWLYCLILESEAARNDLIRHLGERGIAASPVHARNDKHTGFGGTGDARDLRGIRPGVDAFSERECAIPVGWWLTEKDLAHVVAAVTSWAAAQQEDTTGVAA